MQLHITSYYAAVLALLFILLSIKTIKTRRQHKVAIGDGGEKSILRASRVHANFAEYVPLTILLIGMLEMQGFTTLIIHSLGILLVLARVAHAYGVSQTNENFKFRIFGTATTINIIAICALLLLTKSFFQPF
ncbi:MAPEG family protein [Candidatus Methylopumilus turicensis]|uniref:Membrane-associated protein in eicosanoid and glutathione metabolism (MAPEG) n=1 Tax=Candidatus Methylopumilus turicensis TaxID=1581680 RepID=A0A0B7J0W6_9PROT|nr:MAPEG family protein [Candidatus Methylopumilus turicensis]CEN56422.1 Membrane-associated protein in eicosanoid and glutathione metabolism (MAPEG) [Candidatus Methylopumilus turicensis]